MNSTVKRFEHFQNLANLKSWQLKLGVNDLTIKKLHFKFTMPTYGIMNVILFY